MQLQQQRQRLLSLGLQLRVNLLLIDEHHVLRHRTSGWSWSSLHARCARYHYVAARGAVRTAWGGGVTDLPLDMAEVTRSVDVSREPRVAAISDAAGAVDSGVESPGGANVDGAGAAHRDVGIASDEADEVGVARTVQGDAELLCAALQLMSAEPVETTSKAAAWTPSASMSPDPEARTPVSLGTEHRRRRRGGGCRRGRTSPGGCRRAPACVRQR